MSRGAEAPMSSACLIRPSQPDVAEAPMTHRLPVLRCRLVLTPPRRFGRRVIAALLTAAWVLLLPALAHAQATLAGTVRDSSGAVLPGVNVEAASAALIEKSRTAVSDATGQYRIAELPPGAYV